MRFSYIRITVLTSVWVYVQKLGDLCIKPIVTVLK
jgi:hypothetical protein